MIDKDSRALSDRVYDYCRKYGLLDVSAIIAGLSGGPDSVCLLTLLDAFSKSGRTSAKIYAVHVNHNLRPGDCDRDEAFVRDLCEKMDIPLTVKSFDVAGTAGDMGISVEEAGRRIRYGCFRETAESLDCGSYVIATAHHANDLAETMMMNLFRGAGLDGITAMRPVQDGIIRPLLCVNKEEITAFLDENGIGYVTDKTNFEDIGSRNIWRNKIFPYIGNYTSRDPQEALRSAHALLSSDSDFINAASLEAYGTYVRPVGSFKAVECAVSGLHDALFTRVVRRLWKESFGDMTDFENINLRQAAELIGREDQDGFVTVDMPFGRKIWKFMGLAGFIEGDKTIELACALAGNEGYLTSPESISLVLTEGSCQKIAGTVNIFKYTVVENIGDLAYNNHSWICPADLPSLQGRPLLLRNGAGDLRFAKAGGNGGKLVKDVLADRKVPRPARNSVLAVTSGDEVLWLPGAGHATGFTDLRSRDRFLEEGYKGRYLKVEIVPEE